MKALSVSVLDRLDLSRVFRPIPISVFKPIPGICSDRLDRSLKDAFAIVESAHFGALVPSAAGTPSRQDVADSVRSAAVTVSVDRQLTEWELDRIAERLLSQTKRKRRRASTTMIEAKYEIVEPKVWALESNADKGARAAKRAVAEPPTERAVRALRFLKKHGLAKYNSLRKTAVVEWLIERADNGELPYPFDVAKTELRDWLRVKTRREPVEGKRKNGGLPTMETLYKVINSLEPIYQELLESMRSKLAANSEVSRGR